MANPISSVCLFSLKIKISRFHESVLLKLIGKIPKALEETGLGNKICTACSCFYLPFVANLFLLTALYVERFCVIRSEFVSGVQYAKR